MSSNNQHSKAPKEVEIQLSDKITIAGSLSVVNEARGIVVFAHGSGSSRFSPRNRYVADILQQAGLATLLIDLLTKEEEIIDLRTREIRFDIDLLSARVIAATKWLLANSDIKKMSIGYFGASTGAAATLVAAAEFGELIGAAVSRGGRPDLAQNKLLRVKAPTLLIVGGNDPVVIDINEKAIKQLCAEKKLAIVPGAGHLFEEPGKMEQVAQLAVEWFVQHLTKHKGNRTI